MVPADWWDEAYEARLPLTIDETIGGSLVAGYSVVVTLDTAALIAAGDVLSSGNDLRVVWDDGGTPTEIHRHVIDLDSTTTEVWFKTQAAVDGSSGSYAIYFDNAQAGSAPARWSDSMGTATASAVYLAGDDFEDDAVGSMPGGWEGSSAYQVAADGSNQVLEVQSPGGHVADYLFGGDYGWGDVVVSVRVSIRDTTGDYYGLFVRSQPGASFYSAYYGSSTSLSTLQVWDMTIASPTAHDATTNSQLSQGISPGLSATWRTLRVAMLGRDLHFFYEDQPELYTFQVTAGREQGRIGFCVGYDPGQAWWDDVIVRAYVSPEPTVSAGAAESIACP